MGIDLEIVVYIVVHFGQAWEGRELASDYVGKTLQQCGVVVTSCNLDVSEIAVHRQLMHVVITLCIDGQLG